MAAPGSELPDSEAVRALESKRGKESDVSKNYIIASKIKCKKGNNMRELLIVTAPNRNNERFKHKVNQKTRGW